MLHADKLWYILWFIFYINIYNATHAVMFSHHFKLWLLNYFSSQPHYHMNLLVANLGHSCVKYAQRKHRTHICNQSKWSIVSWQSIYVRKILQYVHNKSPICTHNNSPICTMTIHVLCCLVELWSKRNHCYNYDLNPRFKPWSWHAVLTKQKPTVVDRRGVHNTTDYST